MRRLLFSVPRDQRYSCRQCNWCCRWWRIEVDPADRDRLLAHDWAAESPRLRGVALFEERRIPGRADPVIQTAQLEGGCVFLEEDGLCLIHKVLGLEAKPVVCQGFPLVLGRTVEGVLIGASYACSAVVRGEGEPFARQEPLVLDLLERSGDEALGIDTVIDPQPVLAGRTRLTWRAYLEMEKALLQILATRRFPVSARLSAVHGLVSEMRARFASRRRVEEGKSAEWLEQQRLDDYAALLARASALQPVSPARQWETLAHQVADVETAPIQSADRGSIAAGYAAAIAGGTGQVALSTLGGRVDLAAMGRVRCDLDDAPFDGYLTRFLSNFVMRKSLLAFPSLLEGADHLCVYVGLVRWYALASAEIAGRAVAEEEDLVVGIQVVEKAYVHGITT